MNLGKLFDVLKEKIMAMSNSGYGFGWLDPNQTLLGQASQGNSMLGNAAQQAYGSANQARQAQLQMQMAQQQAQLAQQGYNNMFGGGSGSFQQGQEGGRTLSTFNLNANSLYTFDELNDEGSVYNMSLQTAVDLAINMFGSGWFKDEDTIETLEENTDFLIKVLAKLHKAGRLKCETCRDFNTDTLKTAWKILDTDHGNN